MFRLMQLAADAVDIHDALRRIVVSEDLRIEFAEPLRFLLRQGVLHDELIDLRKEAVVRFLVPLGFGEVGAQPSAMNCRGLGGRGTAARVRLTVRLRSARTARLVSPGGATQPTAGSPASPAANLAPPVRRQPPPPP